MKNQLTKKEMQEEVFVTIGRIKGCIESGNTDRALVFLNKLSKDVSKMDLKILRLERGDTKEQIAEIERKDAMEELN